MSAPRPHAWLWQNDTWADFRVNVYPEGPGAEPLYSLLLQSVVLASGSPGHFRGHCTRLKEGTDAASVGDKRLRDDQRASAVYEYKLTLFPGEPEAVPKAVFCHLYTGALPDDVDQLLWMLRRADYLDLAETVLAVLHQLTSLGSERLTLQHAAILCSLPDLQSDTPQQGEPASTKPADTAAPAPGPAKPAKVPAAQQGRLAPAAGAGAAGSSNGPTADSRGKVSAALDTILAAVLPAHLPSAPAIATDAALLAQFSQLPLALIKRWVQLDKYEVDSGNTLAVLFTAWHDAQLEPPSEEQCKQLSALLPLSAVSLHFHVQVLQQLKWWRPPTCFISSALAAHMTAELLRNSPDLHDSWLEAAGGAAVRARATKRAQHTWVVQAAQLEQLWRDQLLPLPFFCMAGYKLGVALVVKYADEQWKSKGSSEIYSGEAAVGLVLTSSLHPTIAQHLGVHPSASRPEDTLETTVRIVHCSPSLTPKECEVHAAFWRHCSGWRELSQQFKFTSLKDVRTGLVPLTRTELTIECEVKYADAPPAAAAAAQPAVAARAAAVRAAPPAGRNRIRGTGAIAWQ